MHYVQVTLETKNTAPDYKSGRKLCKYFPLSHWWQSELAKLMPRVIHILNFVSSFSFNDRKYRINIHALCKLDITKKHFLTWLVMKSSFLHMKVIANIYFYCTMLSLCIVKKCNNSNDLCTFWWNTRKKYIFLQD